MRTSTIKAQMEELFRTGKHAHAYLFCGEMESAKEAALSCAHIATGSAGSLQAGEESGSDGFNPDLLIVNIIEGEQGISIDQVRDIRQFLSLEPYFGKARVVVIEQSERMKNEASSALLKILEEPPAKSAIILLSGESQLILGTILSRVQRVDFPDAKRKQGIDKKEGICNTLASVILAKIPQRFTIIQKMSESEIHSDLFDQLVLFFHDMLTVALSGAEESLHYPFYVKQYQSILSRAGYAPERIASILSSLTEYAHVAKTTNANKRLLLERIALLL